MGKVSERSYRYYLSLRSFMHTGDLSFQLSSNGNKIVNCCLFVCIRFNVYQAMVNEEEEEERKRQKIVKNINVAFRFFVWRLKKLLLVLTLV